MTDFTSFTTDEITAMIMCEFTTRSAPLINNEGSVQAQPIFRTGIGLDTESTTISHKETVGKYKRKTLTVVDHCWCYTYQVAVGRNFYAIYRDIEDLFNFFDVAIDTINYLNIGEDVPAKALIWVANLSHEFSFIKYRLLHRIECKKMFAKTARDCLYLNFTQIEMRECIGLFGRSLSDIADDWCKDSKKLKGDLDYDKVRVSTKDYCTPLDDKERGYMINDVAILTEMHENVYDTYIQDNGVLILPYTRSGFVRTKLKNAIREDETLTKKREEYNEYVRTRDGNDKYIKKNNIEYLKMQNSHLFVNQAQWLLCREYGFTGGLCGSNILQVGKNLKNVRCADLTSDYPACMIHRKYPRGWLKERDLNEYTTIKDSKKIPFFILAIVDFKSKTQHATFSKHKVINYVNKKFLEVYGRVREDVIYNGKILKAKNCIVVLNDIDITAYEMIYDLKITPLKMWTFDGYKQLPKWCTDPLKEDYVTKAVLKHQKLTKTRKYKDSKINANTYFGVFGTRYSDPLDTLDMDPESDTEGLFKPKKRKTYNQQKHDTWLNPYYAFWITSYARRILMYFISKYPDKIVQYDTDSLYYLPCEELEKELREYNDRIIKINSKIFKDHPQKELMLDLGCWDFDDIYDQFLPMGAKKYIKQQGDKIETVIAGLPKSAIPAEIKTKNIKKPLTHYNVTRWVKDITKRPEIIIKHMFTHKFASVYNDSELEYYIDIVDCNGVRARQKCGCYHAIIPIDFTLSMGLTYLQHIFKVQKRRL